MALYLGKYLQQAKMEMELKLHESLQRRQNQGHGVSNDQQLDGLFNYLFKLTSKKISKPTSVALCEGDPLMTVGFPSQRGRNAEIISMAWRHHVAIEFEL